MKKLFAVVALCVSGLVIAGCTATSNKQVLEKSTVFGFQAKTPGTAQGTSITVQLGLVRNEYFSNPTSTNALYASPFNSTVHANLAILNQTADENYGTYQLPTNAYTQPNVSTTIPSVAAPATSTALATNKP